MTETVVTAARELFARRIDLGGQGVRLLGVGVSGLAARPAQESLFPGQDEERAQRLARATDLVRERYGERSVTRARLIKRAD